MQKAQSTEISGRRELIQVIYDPYNLAMSVQFYETQLMWLQMTIFKSQSTSFAKWIVYLVTLILQFVPLVVISEKSPLQFPVNQK